MKICWTSPFTHGQRGSISQVKPRMSIFELQDCYGQKRPLVVTAESLFYLDHTELETLCPQNEIAFAITDDEHSFFESKRKCRVFESYVSMKSRKAAISIMVMSR